MASAYLSRTFGTPTNASKFTYSGWIKRSGLGGNQVLLYANGGNSQNFSNIMFNSGNNFFWHVLHSNSEVSKLRTNAVLRDTSAWYHLVFQYDSTQATANNRTKMYINGVEVTSYGTQTNSGQNSNYHMNTAVEHFIGAEKGNTGGSVGSYFDGQMAHVHFVDGTIYAPSTFGETDATTGEWKPKTDPGISQANYGNNGFFLKFDNSANMGLDSSGNSNNWTTSGTILQYKDTPSNNMPQLNVNDKYAAAISNAGQTVTNENNNQTGVMSTMAVATGKWYWEAKVKDTASDTFNVGMRKTGLKNYAVANWSYSANAFVYAVNGYIYKDGNQSTNTGTSAAVGDIIGFIVDMDAGTVKLQKNGSDIYSGNAVVTGLNTGDFWHVVQGASQAAVDFNFGNGYFGTTAITSAGSNGNGLLFEYDVPSGHYGISTKNISGNS